MSKPRFAICALLNPAPGAPAQPPESHVPRVHALTAQMSDRFDISRAVRPTLANGAMHLSPPRSPSPRLRANRRLLTGRDQRIFLLQQLCEPMLQYIASSAQLASIPAGYLRQNVATLRPLLSAPTNPALFSRVQHRRNMLAYAITACSAHPASHFEMLHALHPDTVFARPQGETLMHGLMRNHVASETEKVACLRLLASLGCDLASRNLQGSTAAIVAARQKHDPYMMLLAIDSWDAVALERCDTNGYSVADALLANPTPHVQSLMMVLCADEMRLHPACPQAWTPPFYPFIPARFKSTLQVKPLGAHSVDGLPLVAV